MRVLLLAFVVAGCCSGDVTNVAVSGTTATQAIVTYLAPNTRTCSLAVSETADANGNPQSPFVHDVDPAIFPGAEQDARPGSIVNGNLRIFVIGRRDAEKGSDGRYYSRALQTNTTHYGKISCGADTALFQFQTANIPLGIGYSDPWPADAAAPGEWAVPSSPGNAANEQIIEPQTGVRLQRLTYPGTGYNAARNMPFGTAYNQGQDPCDSNGPWSNPCNLIGSRATSVTNSSGWLVIRPNNQAFGWGGPSSGFGYSLNQFQISLSGRGDAREGDRRAIDVCLSMNAGASCASKVQTVVFERRNSMVTLGAFQPGALGIDPWLFDSSPRINRPEASTHKGRVQVTGSQVVWAAGDGFSSYWTTGGQGRVRLSNVSVDDACAAPPASSASVEATVASGFGGALTLTSSPGSFSFYCAPDFAVMIRRHTPDDNTSISIQSAAYSYISSQSGEWVDNGFDRLCSDTKQSNGYVCMIPAGGGVATVMWIDPVTGTANTIGPAKANGNSRGSDPWPATPCPLFSPEAFQTFDDTKQVPTWYCLASSGNTPVVLQVTYTGAYDTTRVFSESDAIVAGGPHGQDGYSISFQNAVITNLTPASRGKDLKSLLLAFEPSFDTFLGCHTGPVQQGNLLIYCYRNQDTMSWLAVFSPGDGNPLHAGLPGGPNIIAAMNSWSHGAARWSVNHSVQDYGNSGYFGYSASSMNAGAAFPGNTAVIVTTHSPVPATGSGCSQWGNPMNVTGNNCILLQVDANNGSYEPYFWKAVPPQSQTPGELSTAQIGDIWCLTDVETSCNFVNASNEVLVLLQKSDNGKWVFQRNAGRWTSGPKEIAGNGIKYLVAMSGATNMNYYDHRYPSFYSVAWGGNVFWDYLNDPHGLTPFIDPGYFDSHAVQRPTIAVESGQYPYSPWGGVYRVRHASSFQQLFASPVSYVNASPSFAGAFMGSATSGYQSHPSVSGDSAAASEGQAAFDVRPLVGKFAGPPGAPDFWSPVSGQLWKTTYPVKDPDNIGNLNRKLLPTAASSGSHPLIDVSGPSSSISDDAADSYKYCIPRVNRECRPDSSVGDVYVNAPGVVFPYCYGTVTNGQTSPANDICLDNMPAIGQSLVQFSTLQSDPTGRFQRVLVKPMTGRPKLTSGFANARALPDNSWILFQANYLDSARREVYMAKLPPFPAPDGVDRSTFLPLPLNLTPPSGAGITNALVQFGYQEYNGNCTTRNEACLAYTPTIGATPFQYAGENPPGAPCSNGCTVEIPAVSQRILYYKVIYRDASNNVRAATPMQAIATP